MYNPLDTPPHTMCVVCPPAAGDLTATVAAQGASCTAGATPALRVPPIRSVRVGVAAWPRAGGPRPKRRCADLVPQPEDAPPVRSPQALHDAVAALVEGRRVVEIGSRKGDGAMCFVHSARSVTVTGGDADVYTSQGPLRNGGALGELRRMVAQGSVRAEAEAAVVFDTQWHRDMGDWAWVQHQARWHAWVPFDEIARCREVSRTSSAAHLRYVDVYAHVFVPPPPTNWSGALDASWWGDG
eukprot:gene10166-44053_t